MEIKNSTNILISKFTMIYKVLLYIFIYSAIILALGTCIIVPSMNKVVESPEGYSLITNLRGAFSNFLNGSISFEGFLEVFKLSYTQFMELVALAKIPATFWITVVLIFIFMKFFIARCYPAITDIFNNFMSSNLNYGFTSSLIKNYKIGFSYAANYTLLTAPVDALIIFLVAFLFKILFPLINMFALTICLLVYIVLIALRITFLSGVLPVMYIEGEKNFYKALKKSWGMVKSYFANYYSYLCTVIFILYCLTALLTVVTFGIAFILLVAVTIIYLRIMELTYYYGRHKMCYYVDSNIIINTAPIEDRLDLQRNDTIKIENQKNINTKSQIENEKIEDKNDISHNDYNLKDNEIENMTCDIGVKEVSKDKQKSNKKKK